MLLSILILASQSSKRKHLHLLYKYKSSISIYHKTRKCVYVFRGILPYMHVHGYFNLYLYYMRSNHFTFKDLLFLCAYALRKQVGIGSYIHIRVIPGFGFLRSTYIMLDILQLQRKNQLHRPTSFIIRLLSRCVDILR